LRFVLAMFAQKRSGVAEETVPFILLTT
jgi:hypothetical protein